MRRCLPGDLIEVAALLAASCPTDQPALARRLIAQADAAHRYVKRFGRAHPLWGNGSLMARAMAEPRQPKHPLNSAAFFFALALLASDLAGRKQDTQA